MYFEFAGPEPRAATWTPIVDVLERPTEIVVLVEMPGVNRSDVQLSWNEGILIIAGCKRQQLPERGKARYLCVERPYGQFRREITVNIPVDRKRAKAELKNGLMRISLPKSTSKPEATTIPIL